MCVCVCTPHPLHGQASKGTHTRAQVRRAQAGVGAHLARGLQRLLQRLQLGRGHPVVQVQQEPQDVPLHALLPGGGAGGLRAAEALPPPHPSSSGQGRDPEDSPWGGGEEEAVEEAAAEVLQGELVGQQGQAAREQV